MFKLNSKPVERWSDSVVVGKVLNGPNGGYGGAPNTRIK